MGGDSGGRMGRVQVTNLDWDAALLAQFLPSVEANPWGWGTPYEVLSGSIAYAIERGAQRAIIAVRPIERQQGLRLDITGMVSTGQRLCAPDVGRALDQIGAQFGARAIAMATLRPHLARAALRIGFVQAGVLMTRRTEALQ